MGFTILSASFISQSSHHFDHYHDCHQLFFVTRGTANIQINNTISTAKSGDLVVISRFSHHRIVEQSADYQRYVLQLSPDFSTGYEPVRTVSFTLFNRPAVFQNILSVGAQQSQFRQIFEAIMLQMRTRELLYTQLLDLLVQQLFIHIYRQLPAHLRTTDGNCFEIVYQIQNRFQNEYATQFCLQALATEYGISPSYLSHLFKKATGNSVMGYLLSCRIAAAQKHLTETDMPIKEIIAACGFSDCSNFSRTFHRITGFSPTQFRLQCRSTNSIPF